MKGRLEHKLETESQIQDKIESMPEYMHRFYYFINLKTHNTKKRYVCNVLRFLDYYRKGETVTLDDLNKVDAFEIQKYISSISYYERDDGLQELAEGTKACILSSLSVFFKFLAGNQYIVRNPFDGDAIDRPKIQEKEIIYLNKEEVRKVEKSILDGVGNDLAVARQEEWKYRDFCLFWLPVVNGIRVGALSEINVEDVDMKDKSISVIEKGNRPTTIYFDDKAALYLRLWMEKRARLLNGEKCDALFISNRKKRITIRSIENLIGKYTENSINRHISPHKLRATFATNLYGKTRDIELTAKALHHKSTIPTQKYVKVFDQDVRNAVNLNLYN